MNRNVAACRLAQTAGAGFVKTSTGFAGGGVKVEGVRLTVGTQIGVKTAGGVRCYADALAMIETGANRIAASAGVQIVEQSPPN